MLGLNKLVWIGIAMAVLQQFVGINFFTTSVITSVINVVMTFLAILFVDKVGRRKLLLVDSVGMFVGLVLAAVAFSQQIGTGGNVSLPAPYGILALIGANLFVIFFAATWGPILWVMLGEMFPNRMRVLALGIGTAANWVANFITSSSSIPLVSGTWHRTKKNEITATNANAA